MAYCLFVCILQASISHKANQTREYRIVYSDYVSIMLLLYPHFTSPDFYIAISGRRSRYSHSTPVTIKYTTTVLVTNYYMCTFTLLN